GGGRHLRHERVAFRDQLRGRGRHRGGYGARARLAARLAPLRALERLEGVAIAEIARRQPQRLPPRDERVLAAAQLLQHVAEPRVRLGIVGPYPDRVAVRGLAPALLPLRFHGPPPLHLALPLR